MKKLTILFIIGIITSPVSSQNTMKEKINTRIQKSTPELIETYKHLHATPELSFYEFETAKFMAVKLKDLGFEVTTNFGGNGVVGVFKNGNGPVIMMRTDMDALPIQEKTNLPYASTVRMKNDKGEEVPVMHACGHDMHMTVFLATAKTLIELKDNWNGTLLFVAQQAEERSGGANAMIADGLFSKFPKPNYALAYHVSASLPAGKIGYCPGAIFAGVSSVDVTFYGVGGHGAYPHKTIDPIVMASEAIMMYQTIVSREISPTDPAVLTVGSIHGGSQHNIIPDEVKLQLTLRSYKTEVNDHLVSSIKRISESVARSAGMPEDKLPAVMVINEGTPPLINNDELLRKSKASFENVIGSDNIIRVEQAMVGEDFGKYGLTDERIPICLYWLGSVDPETYAKAQQNGEELPALHSPYYAPTPEKTLQTGASAMVQAIIDLMNRK